MINESQCTIKKLNKYHGQRCSDSVFSTTDKNNCDLINRMTDGHGNQDTRIQTPLEITRKFNKACEPKVVIYTYHKLRSNLITIYDPNLLIKSYRYFSTTKIKSAIFIVTDHKDALIIITKLKNLVFTHQGICILRLSMCYIRTKQVLSN